MLKHYLPCPAPPVASCVICVWSVLGMCAWWMQYRRYCFHLSIYQSEEYKQYSFTLSFSASPKAVAFVRNETVRYLPRSLSNAEVTKISQFNSTCVDKTFSKSMIFTYANACLCNIEIGSIPPLISSTIIMLIIKCSIPMSSLYAWMVCRISWLWSLWMTNTSHYTHTHTLIATLKLTRSSKQAGPLWI